MTYGAVDLCSFDEEFRGFPPYPSAGWTAVGFELLGLEERRMGKSYDAWTSGGGPVVRVSNDMSR